ncbi:ABC transporter substrate-binding protein [Actinomadura citrea]|uniref:NitT/TauT family transport system substrate-binding protein n=1 Tax=Actinomadura citrea TaxID=46158 RepID=A0A7Y9GEK9_9ACTN|nr:ABC transporter substrate-binding protein [Actinomadura citrea]NYE15079.1 NitT/TauT family transport system substrate-binding protein [Actinomadura citrea]GGT85203.1 aliphatic sulfonate ABC transporter substrate-binding protein [Actinomadura citrea]
MIRIRAAAAAAACALLLAACGSGGGGADASGDGPASVKVSVIPIVDVAPIYLGRQQGFFAEQGLKLELASAQGGAAIVPAVVSGQVDFGFSNYTSLILARSKGLPLKVVAPGAGSTGVKGRDFGGVVVKTGSPVRSAKDLAGKRVAVNTLNNINDTTVRASIRAAGGDAENVRFTELAFPDMLAALDKGNVDAVQVVEPFLTTALKNGGRLVASNYVDTAPDLTVAGYFTSQKTAAAKPELVKRFAAAMRKSLGYAADNPDAVRKVLGTYTKIDPALTSSLTLPTYPAQVNAASLKTLSALAVQDGLIKTAPDVKDLLP